jgi:putative ABC transport system substrate-binding protein
VLSPVRSAAQEAGRTYRIAFLIPSPRATAAVVASFDELRKNGFAEGRNLVVLPGGFEVPNDELHERAAELVALAPDVIVSGPELPLRALQQQTSTIPLLGITEDMVAEGLVASLARPGGNISGISLLSPELDGKRQDLIIESVPGMKRLAAFGETSVTPPQHIQVLKDAASAHKVELLFFGLSKSREVVPALNAAKVAGAEAVNFLASPLFSVPGSAGAARAVQATTELRLPSIFQWPETAEQGGLVAYGPRFTEAYRQRARMVARVLRGTKPADLPVEQPTSFELVVNLKVATAIGHDIPDRLVLRADRLVE